MKSIYKIFTGLVLCIFTLLFYNNPAEAQTYSDFGISIEMPDFMIFKEPDPGNVMTAVAKSGENIRMSAASINMGKDEYDEEELEKLRLYLHQMYLDQGIKVRSSFIDRNGQHKIIFVQADYLKNEYVNITSVIAHLYVHNRRYIVVYTFNNLDKNKEFEMMRHIGQIRCTSHQ